MRLWRLQLLCYMVWILAWFLPGHVRGRMTMGPRETGSSPRSLSGPHSCCAPTPQPAGQPLAPTAKDKANCAVCFWAAGLMPVAPVVIEVRPIDVHRVIADAAIAQCETWFVRSDSLARGPPVTPA